MTKVVSIYSGEPYDILVDRSTPYGNPFSHLRDTLATFHTNTRLEAVQRHSAWVRSQLALVTKIRGELRGRTLACRCGTGWIRRGLCHAVTLARIADENIRPTP